MAPQIPNTIARRLLESDPEHAARIEKIEKVTELLRDIRNENLWGGYLPVAAADTLDRAIAELAEIGDLPPLDSA